MRAVLRSLFRPSATPSVTQWRRLDDENLASRHQRWTACRQHRSTTRETSVLAGALEPVFLFVLQQPETYPQKLRACRLRDRLRRLREGALRQALRGLAAAQEP